MRKASEPAMDAETRERLRVVLGRMRVIAPLEVRARREADRLLDQAWRLGATDHTIAAAMGLSLDAARMRRRRAGLRRGPRGRGLA